MAVNKVTDETYEELIQNESAVVLLDLWIFIAEFKRCRYSLQDGS